MGIDFDSDIAPLRQQFFPMLTGAASFDRSMNFYQKNIAPMREQTMKMQSQIMALRSQELQFEKQRMALEQMKNDIRTKREIGQLMPAVTSRVDQLIEGDAPISEKRDEFNSFAADYASQIARSPELKTYFDIQLKRLNDLQKEAAKDEAREQSRRNYDAQVYASQSQSLNEYDPDIATGILSGEVDSGEVFKSLGERREELAKEEKSRAEFEKLTEVQKDREKKVVGDIIKLTDTPKMSKSETVPDGDKPTNVDSFIESSGPVKLDDIYRSKVAEAMVTLQSLPPTQENIDAVLKKYKENDKGLLLETRRMANRRLDFYATRSEAPLLTPISSIKNRDDIGALSGTNISQ